MARSGNAVADRGLTVRSMRALRPVLALILFLGVTPLQAAGSELPEGSSEVAQREFREEPVWLAGDANSANGAGLWFWPEGRRIYQVIGRAGGGTGVYAYDADTLDRVAQIDLLVPSVWGTMYVNEYSTGSGRPHVGAVDREEGRLFLAYRTTVNDATSGSETPCVGRGTNGDPGCVGGIHVLDGDTLESQNKIPLSLPTLEGPRAQPIVRALEYAPADAARGWGGRVLMVVEEIATGPLENSVAPGANAAVQNTTMRRNSANIAYAVAFDPDSGKQEWAVRLEGCRNGREARNWLYSPEPHPTAIFRSGGDAPALYVGCHGNSAQQGVVVRVPLDDHGYPAVHPVIVGDPVSDLDPEADDAGAGSLVQQAPRQEAFAGPDKVDAILADPQSQRLLLRVHDSGQVWWVFDGRANQFTGTIGIGSYIHGHTTFGLDPDIGRLYVLAAKPTDSTGPGGLYVADIRRDPLPQALHYPELADPERRGKTLDAPGATEAGRVLNVEPRGDGSSTRLMQSVAPTGGREFRVLRDLLSPSADDVEPEVLVRTLDIDEAEGITEATFDGTARGFGFRAILLGGVEAALRTGPADPLGVPRGARQLDMADDTVAVTNNVVPGSAPAPLTERLLAELPPPDPCSDAQREVILAFAGPESPAVVDASSARGEAQAVVADVRTQEDLGAPASRCGPMDWPELWESALVSRPPMEEPGADWPFDDGRSSCTTTREETSESWRDPLLGAFTSHVTCSEDEVSGWGQARGVNLEGISVAHTLSTFRIYRDPGRGLVARVESIARGINVGAIKIDTVRGSAESWANGRLALDNEGPADAQDAFNPYNCDFARSAGTCFQRHIFGVSAVAPDGKRYGCGPCGDEVALIDGLNRALGANGMARFREPNAELARGSDDGYLAAITKKDKERFADIVLNADLLETMVPMLEIIRYAPHNRPSNDGGSPSYTMGTPPRGRQVYQFAAVEVSSTYSIQCLLVYDEESNTCGAPVEEPGAITVSLQDGEGEPLAGGAFEVRQDVDADGVLGLVDTLLPDGACVTAEDGVGTCSFENLEPGSYLVSQVSAPPGYAKSDEPFVVELGPGEQRTVAFTNVSNVSTIELTAQDEHGGPLEGATFAAYPDPDADGKVAPEAQPAATCTTGADGTCTMKVPAGSYVLVQTAAPGGLEGIEPVPFTFASGGQVAAVTITNYPPEAGGVDAPPPAPSPVYTPPVDIAPPVEVIEGYTPPAGVQEPETVGPGVIDQVGGTVVQVIRAPGDALRLLARDPKQAVAWTAALALFCLAIMAIRRRQQAIALIAD